LIDKIVAMNEENIKKESKLLLRDIKSGKGMVRCAV